MFVKTIQKQGKAIQYLGNIKALESEFPILNFTQLQSKTLWEGNLYYDVRVSDSTRSEDLLVGDWIIRINDKWDIIPMGIFEEYWEEV